MLATGGLLYVTQITGEAYRTYSVRKMGEQTRHLTKATYEGLYGHAWLKYEEKEVSAFGHVTTRKYTLTTLGQEALT